MRAETYCTIHIRVNHCGMWPDATRFLPYKDVIQVELKSTQPNHVFCPMVPLKYLGCARLGVGGKPNIFFYL